MKEFINNLKFACKYTNNEKVKIVVIVWCNIIRIILSVIAPILSARIIIYLKIVKV